MTTLYTFPTPQVRELALRFPSLAGAPMGSTAELAAWAKTAAPDAGARWAAIFILSVWSPDTPAEHGLMGFEVHDAMKSWDRVHQAAFSSWAKQPFWG
jgi:hypothetical protein